VGAMIPAEAMIPVAATTQAAATILAAAMSGLEATLEGNNGQP